LDNDRFELPDDRYNREASVHHDNPDIMKYIDKFVNLDLNSLYIAFRTPKLFYFWGHSSEFEKNRIRNIWKKFASAFQKKIIFGMLPI